MPDKNVLIIRELLEAGDDYVSGSHLATLIGVSRVSIWSYMEKMKEQGYDFEAIRSKGYRMIQRPEQLNETLVQALLSQAAKSLRTLVLSTVDSTNSEAARRLANNEPTPFVVIAEKQINGRGRMGRVWHSPQNGNLYSSFAFCPQVSPAAMPLFTLWMGVNVCECLTSLCRLQCSVKWPNDIHIDGKKVAGILTEARMETDQVRDVILGIGLNVNSSGEDWPDELKHIATSIRQATGQAFDINRLTAAIAGRIMIAYQQFLDGDHRAALKEKWNRFDMLEGKSVSLMQGSNKIAGIANGIDSSGSLIIEKPNGTRFLARAGEVTLEKPAS